MTNKRPLPESLTYAGVSPLKKENFVTEYLGKLTIEGKNELDGDHKQNQKNTSTMVMMRVNGDRDEEDEGTATPVSSSSSSSCASSSSSSNPTSSSSSNSDPTMDDDSGQRHDQQLAKYSDQDFTRLMVLGTGSFAKVILVKLNSTGKMYAMKMLDKEKIVKQKQMVHTMTERSVLGLTSKFPFIVSLHFAYQTDRTLNLVMDFCCGGELYYHLSRVGRFSLERARFYTAELTLALEHLHSFNIVYRDLKPENVLIGSDGHIMLADFGLSKEGIFDCSKGTDTFCGTPEYLAPEILYRKGHGKAVDWWSLGILLYEMLTGLPPWYSKNRRKMFEGICSRSLQFPAAPELHRSTKSIIAGLLVKNPQHRLGSNGAEDVKNHDFFMDVDFNLVLSKAIEAPWKPKENKVYFDVAYTQQTVESPKNGPSRTNGGLLTPKGVLQAKKMQSQDQMLEQNLQQNPMAAVEKNKIEGVDGDHLACSPLFPSSLVEKAFVGFSYTDPSACGALRPASISPKSSSPSPRFHHSFTGGNSLRQAVLAAQYPKQHHHHQQHFHHAPHIIHQQPQQDIDNDHQVQEDEEEEEELIIVQHEEVEEDAPPGCCTGIVEGEDGEEHEVLIVEEHVIEGDGDHGECFGQFDLELDEGSVF